ncbi:Crp/Fnr family transcriptional regulator [Flavobacterium tegetincola]|uniref:Crp/Fnr family transcriptional regulator n=1 Tax=Flavobacterium tegetincola TaxID=150172 RepID=UPI0003F74D49|nr:Crp/Fnr family transcriptional regulator [Flavobacterium tegetincola]
MHHLLTSFLRSKGIHDDKIIELVCNCFTLKEIKSKSILVDYTAIADAYYFINKGAVRIFTINSEGAESSRYFAFEGNFVAALPSFIDQKPAEEYMQTIEKCELLKISRTNFYKLVETVPTFAKIYTEILELGFIIAQKRIYGFQGFDALEKVQWTIKNQPQLLLRISNKMVASYLGISPSTLSRIKSKL